MFELFLYFSRIKENLTKLPPVIDALSPAIEADQVVKDEKVKFHPKTVEFGPTYVTGTNVNSITETNTAKVSSIGAAELVTIDNKPGAVKEFAQKTALENKNEKMIEEVESSMEIGKYVDPSAPAESQVEDVIAPISQSAATVQSETETITDESTLSSTPTLVDDVSDLTSSSQSTGTMDSNSTVDDVTVLHKQ